MTINKRVTIGIPTFNRPDGLEKTLKCIENQTHKNLKVMISDNCSNDKEGYNAVVNRFSEKFDLEYIRQEKNLGAILNMKFLLDRANDEYFMWVTDDDEFDPEFVESMLALLESDSDSVIAMTGFDASDLYSGGYTNKSFLEHLQKLPNKNLFERMRIYADQPDYQGKARILWGLHRTKVAQKAYSETLEPVAHKDDLTFAELPIEYKILSLGNLSVVPKDLLHVYLLPSSLGLAEGKMFTGKESEMCRRTYDAYRYVVDKSELNEEQKKIIKKIINKKEANAQIMVWTYSVVQKYFPWVSPTLKKIWFWLKT